VKMPRAPMVGNSPATPSSIPEPTRPPVIVQAPPDPGSGAGGMDPQMMQMIMAVIAMMMHSQQGGAGMPPPAAPPSTEPFNPNMLPPMGPTGPGLPMQGAPNPLAAMMGGMKGR
jgi:hypothetical protein